MENTFIYITLINYLRTKRKLKLYMQHSDFEKQLYIYESRIHGKGIFTSIDIPEGTPVLKISGEIISGDECERREEEENNVYIFWNGDDSYIDTATTDKIKYINHRCEYNCDVIESENNQLMLVATKNINAGEELTIDYGYDEIYDVCPCVVCDNKNQ